MDQNIRVIGTIHSTHEENPNYTYEMLYDAIDVFSPDIIGVEIRQQDMVEPEDYLAKYYPPEMVRIKSMYEKHIEVFGFDWRGKEIEDRPIEEWQKKVPHLWTIMQKEEVFEAFVKERRALIHPFYETCTMDECQKGVDHELMNAMEKKLYKLLREYGHHPLIDYYEEREGRIQEYIIQKIRENPKKKVLVITGASHRKDLVAQIEKRLSVKVS